MATAAEGGFAGGMDLEVDGASVIYHRDRSVAWASKEVTHSEHDDVSKAIKRARSVGSLVELFAGKTDEECRDIVDAADSKLLKMHDGEGRSWIDVSGRNSATGASRYADYLRYNHVYCLDCATKITLTNGNSGNLKKHENTHNGAVAGGGGRNSLIAFKRVPLISTGGRIEVERELRSLTTAAFVSAGVNPHELRVVCAMDTVSAKAWHALYESGVTLGTRVPADMESAELLVDGEVQRRVAGKKGAIVTDGATFRHMHAFGIRWARRGRQR